MRLCHHPVRWQPASTYVAGRRSATYGLVVFGQSRVGTGTSTALTWVGTRVSTYAAIRMGQAVKLPRLLSSLPERHVVTPWAPQCDYEYMVIVGKRP